MLFADTGVDHFVRQLDQRKATEPATQQKTAEEDSSSLYESNVPNCLEFMYSITDTQLYKCILPNMYNIPRLEKNMYDTQVLFPVQYSNETMPLLKSQNIVIINALVVNFERYKMTGECIGVIVKIPIRPLHHICVFINNVKKTIHFLDSGGGSMEIYPVLGKKLAFLTPQYSIIYVQVPRHNGHNSLSHAFLNAKALVFWLEILQNSRHAME